MIIYFSVPLHLPAHVSRKPENLFVCLSEIAELARILLESPLLVNQVQGFTILSAEMFIKKKRAEEVFSFYVDCEEVIYMQGPFC